MLPLSELSGLSRLAATAITRGATSFPSRLMPVSQSQGIIRGALDYVSEVVPFDGWIPFYDLARTSPGGPDGESGWVACGEDLAVERGWFAVQVAGSSLGARIPQGSVVLLRPMEGEPEPGTTVLVDLAERIDPDTGSRFALRTWSPIHDEADRLVRLSLAARADTGLAPLEIADPASVRVLGRMVSRIEIVDLEL